MNRGPKHLLALPAREKNQSVPRSVLVNNNYGLCYQTFTPKSVLEADSHFIRHNVVGHF